MVKKIIIFLIFISIISAYAFFDTEYESVQNEIQNRETIFEKNNLVGYDGEIEITVDSFDSESTYLENFEFLRKSKNVGMTYKAYLECNENKERLVIYNSPHNAKLELIVDDDVLNIYMNDNLILDSAKSDRFYENALSQNEEIHKFPYFIVYYIKIFKNKEDRASLISYVNIYASVENYINSLMKYGSMTKEFTSMTFDDKWHLSEVFVVDNLSEKYNWKKNGIESINYYSSTENATIKFLNKKSWIIRK